MVIQMIVCINGVDNGSWSRSCFWEYVSRIHPYGGECVVRFNDFFHNGLVDNLSSAILQRLGCNEEGARRKSGNGGEPHG